LILSWIITNATKKIPIPEAPPVTIADKPGLISIFFLVVVKILFYWFYNRKGGVGAGDNARKKDWRSGVFLMAGWIGFAGW
jgi:hypothetical protein